MKIAGEMNPFAHERALIIAMGVTKASVHFAHQGKIDYVGSVAVPSPTFSDREGFFLSTGRGLVLRSGSVYEDQKEWRQKRFMRELMTRLDKLTIDHEATSLYMFCPAHMRRAVVSELEKRFPKHLRFVLEGYHVDDHPFVLLDKIAAARAKAFEVLHRPRSETERSFLGRGAFAKRLSKLRKRSPT